MSFLWNQSKLLIDNKIGQRSVFDNLGRSKMDVWRAVGREALLDNPEMLLWDIAKIKHEQHFNNDKISAEEFSEYYGDSGLEYEPNMTEDNIRYLLERKKQQEINEHIIARGKGGLVEATGKFGTAVLSSLLSPTNIALSFVPIGGQARWASFTAKHGKLLGTATRGAVSGGVFQAGFEPLIKYSRDLMQRPYSLEESIANIGVNAVFGSIVNMAGYGIGRIREKFKEVSFEDLYIARKQLEDGKHIDLDVPRAAESIYENSSNIEALQVTENIPAIEFISKHRSKKIGFKEFLRQTELRSKTISQELLCGLMNDLEKADLVYAFKSKYLGKANYQADMARELANLSMNNKPVGFTGSKVAANLAQIVHKWQNIGLERAAKAGAHITPLDGYITRQMHSSDAIRNMGYEGWLEFIVPLLDMEKTKAAYEIPASSSIYFRETYNSLATGVHKDSTGSHSSGYDLSKQLSAERKLHFKSADHWLLYNEKCGKYNLSDSILLNLQNLGKSVGLLDMLGSKPREAFTSLKLDIIDSLKESAANGDRIAMSDIKYLQSNKLDNVFDFMHGINPDNPTLAGIGRATRSLKSMSNLGSVVISSLPDIASWVGELSNQGIPILRSYSHLLTDLVKNMTSKDRRDFARNLGVASESMLGLAYDRLNVESQALGTISKMSNLFFKVNCMDWWDSSFKSAMGMVLSKNLASKVNTPFKQLPNLLQNQLSRYNINETNWHLYKHFRQKKDSQYYLIPDSNIDENLANNLRRYFLDRADTSVATPHAAEKVVSLWGTKAGTGVGEFVRFFMQFKTFPISYVMRPLNAASLEKVPAIKKTGILSQDLVQALENPSTIASMTHLLMATTLLGYLSISAKNMLKGQDIPDPEDPKVWTASIIKGGGLGIFGDFIFNEYDRYGRTFLAEAQGPVLADINSIASIVTKIKDGKATKAEEEALRLMINNTPGRNLFYLLPAMTMIEK